MSFKYASQVIGLMVVLCFWASPSKADSLNYTLTGLTDGVSISFQLQSITPTPTGCTLPLGGCTGSFGFINTAVTINGVTSVDEVDFSSSTFGGGMDILSGTTFLVNIVFPDATTQFFTGSLTNPTMVTGTFDLQSVRPCSQCSLPTYNEQFTVTVAPVPEPSTLLVLGIGMLGFVGLPFKKLLST